MADHQGKFVWYELLTTDRAGAEAFYKAVCGWTSARMGQGDQAYVILNAGGRGVAGISPNPPAAAGPVWMGYLATDDVDGDTARAREAGATLHYGPDDIPGIGRFAMIGSEVAGILFLFNPIPPEGGPPPPVAPGTPGHFSWRELISKDGARGFDFFAGLVGWTKGEGYDMGEMGTYQLYKAADGEELGGIMTGPPGSPAPFWNYYVTVESIAAAIGRLEPLGGKVIMGPHQVPGGRWIVQAVDPQGGMFSLVSDNA